jgi:hypothetical protein
MDYGSRRARIDAAWKAIRSTFYGGLVLSATDQANSGESGMSVTDERDKRTYALSGKTVGVTPGDRMKLQAKKAKPKAPDKTLV